jgi:hypothetical protein
MSGQRAVFQAPRRAGVVPTPEALGTVTWFFAWVRKGLGASAEFQPDCGQDDPGSTTSGKAPTVSQPHEAAGV